MADRIQTIMGNYDYFDRNIEGNWTIKSLNYLDFESSEEEIPLDGRLVLVLVEERLFSPIKGGKESLPIYTRFKAEAKDLIPRLLRFKGDLRAEGFYSRFISTNVYRGPRKQDGRTILALRSFFQDVKNQFQKFAGVILIGEFPDATLVRRFVWAPKSTNEKIGNITTDKTRILVLGPEIIATRSDIVLADLTGNWNSIYNEDPVNIEAIVACPDPITNFTEWPVEGVPFISSNFKKYELSFEDFFWIKDDSYSIKSIQPPSIIIDVSLQLQHPEVSSKDLQNPNPIAKPDIMVSRINTNNVAENPNPQIKGDDGTTPLDASGHPQTFKSSIKRETNYEMFVEDPILERNLLCDYFDRNHRFRIGTFNKLPFRAGSIAYPTNPAKSRLCANPEYVEKASKDFKPSLIINHASLLDFVKWMKQPAVLRHINAHSTLRSSDFGPNYNVSDLEKEIGGHPFRWKRTGNGPYTYKPSLEEQNGKANSFVYRTMWENQYLRNSGANLFIHQGCSAAMVDEFQTKLYFQEGYAEFQNAESVLFYLNGLAIIARAKPYWDVPTNFPEAFSKSSMANFGDGWKTFYDYEAKDSTLNEFKKYVDSKKAYLWSMFGDWTVRLRYMNGVGILGLSNDIGPELEALAIHPNEAWIEDWKFDYNLNKIRVIGDFDGDGKSEFIITSDWGMGIIKYENENWHCVAIAKNGTKLSGWRVLDTKYDEFGPVGDFDGDGKDEVLIINPDGFGILKLDNDTVHSIYAVLNNAKLGNWVLNTEDNKFGPVGNFDGDPDGQDEIIVTSPWGVGILKLTGNKMDAILMAKNGTKTGTGPGYWLFNTKDDKFGPVGDFDGDGKDEILITKQTNPGYIGLLKLNGTMMNVPLMIEDGNKIDGWNFNSKDKFGPVGDFDGDGKDEILITSPWGIGILKLINISLLAATPNGITLEHARSNIKDERWTINTKDDKFGPVGDFDGDGKDEILITGLWGNCIMKYLPTSNPIYDMKALSVHAHNSYLGDWFLENKDKIIGVGNFTDPVSDTDPVKQEILIQR